MNLGDFIRIRRGDLGISNAEIAEAVGVNRSTVCRWQTGRVRKIEYGHLIPLSKVLDFDPARFIREGKNEEDEVWELRREMAERPEMKTLFSLAKSATAEDVKFANEMLIKFRRESGYSDE